MCGIAGIFNYRTGEPVDEGLLREMTRILTHRGPDGEGIHFSERRDVGLGHRRLAIIDLVTGEQPLANEDGTVWVTFNGEIYNYRELREQLRDRGHTFRTSSDTEVVVHAYEEWGRECPLKFNGIFAFSVWDEKNRQLLLARDRFGVKPLYYHDSGTRLLFASELKSLLLDPGVSKSIDLDALNLCLTFRHTPSPWTLFRDIRKIPPASFVLTDANGVRTGRYWNETVQIDRSRSEAEWVADLRAMYPEAVRRQMVSDVPIGISLSSGIDSNVLLALMSTSTSNVHSFSVGFEGGDRRDDEIDAAVAAARSVHADFATERILEQDYSNFMERYLWHLEEPIGNESAAAYYFVAKLARPKVKVLLSGQGADEPFAGYGRHTAARYMPAFKPIPRSLFRALGGSLLSFTGGREEPRRFLDALTQSGEAREFLSIYSITTPAMRDALFNGRSKEGFRADLPEEYVQSQLDAAPQGTMLERMTYVDTRTSLPDNLLLCGDKMAMAASIEMRVPFLDLKLMDIAEKIPGSMKVSLFRNKVIHKKVCRAWLSDEMVERRKIGFNNPMAHWLKNKLDVLLNDLISSPGSITREYLNGGYVSQLQLEHRSGERDHHRLLFLLLSLEMWNRVFVTK